MMNNMLYNSYFFNDINLRKTLNVKHFLYRGGVGHFFFGASRFGLWEILSPYLDVKNFWDQLSYDEFSGIEHSWNPHDGRTHPLSSIE